jgi:methylglutaconyl-CoA hydratase
VVEGAALGGGAGLVAACDLAIAAKDAVFAFSEVRLGLIPATISPYVVRAIGPRTARMLFASGRRFSAEEALRYGLVHEVASDSNSLSQAMEAASQGMFDVAPEASRLAKRLAEDVFDRKLDHGLLEFTAHAIAKRRASEEGREGVAAFLGKRRPSWAI